MRKVTKGQGGGTYGKTVRGRDRETLRKVTKGQGGETYGKTVRGRDRQTLRKVTKGQGGRHTERQSEGETDRH